jgi:hypothetical protein
MRDFDSIINSAELEINPYVGSRKVYLSAKLLVSLHKETVKGFNPYTFFFLNHKTLKFSLKTSLGLIQLDETKGKY